MKTPLVSKDWLTDNIDDPQLVILDASMKNNVAGRSPEFPDISIRGARYFDLKGKFSDVNSSLPNTLPAPSVFEKAARELGINRDSKIVVYDNLGIYSAPRVWWMFNAMGHDQVAVLDGGLSAWKKAGLPVEETEHQAYPHGDFTASFDKEKLKNAEQVLENIKRKDFVTIDARSEGRFSGATPEPRKESRSGHVPGSVNLPYTSVLNDNFYKPETELRKIFISVNPQNKPMTFTCGSGLTACIILLAAELAGTDHKSVYDGSWTEWGSLKNFPVATDTAK
ncbi:MAG: sulfurtransferase [Cyclobacteriaceae bacterium]